jgi:anti-anti-sigma factor
MQMPDRFDSSSLDAFSSAVPDNRAAFIREASVDTEVVHVFGDIDLANKAEFEKAIEDGGRSGLNVSVNLTKCRYIDSTALNVLCKAHSELGERLGVVAVRGPIKRIFDVSGVGDFLGVTYEDALPTSD